jgi:hypothetical protein
VKTKPLWLAFLATLVLLPLTRSFSQSGLALTVSINPAAAISNHAQWRIADPSIDGLAWHDSGYTAYQIPQGTTVTVEFTPVSGPCNITPSKLVVTMTKTLSRTGIYAGSGGNVSQCK